MRKWEVVSDSERRKLIGTLFSQDEAKERQHFYNQRGRDEKGRLRWEGAFNGGLTAGFHNTVGSKTGWTPKTYIKGKKEAELDVFAELMDEDELLEYRTRQVTKRKPEIGVFCRENEIDKRLQNGLKIIKNVGFLNTVKTESFGQQTVPVSALEETSLFSLATQTHHVTWVVGDGLSDRFEVESKPLVIPPDYDLSVSEKRAENETVQEQDAETQAEAHKRFAERYKTLTGMRASLADKFHDASEQQTLAGSADPLAKRQVQQWLPSEPLANLFNYTLKR